MLKFIQKLFQTIFYFIVAEEFLVAFAEEGILQGHCLSDSFTFACPNISVGVGLDVAWFDDIPSLVSSVRVICHGNSTVGCEGRSRGVIRETILCNEGALIGFGWEKNETFGGRFGNFFAVCTDSSEIFSVIGGRDTPTNTTPVLCEPGTFVCGARVNSGGANDAPTSVLPTCCNITTASGLESQILNTVTVPPCKPRQHIATTRNRLNCTDVTLETNIKLSSRVVDLSQLQESDWVDVAVKNFLTRINGSSVGWALENEKEGNQLFPNSHVLPNPVPSRTQKATMVSEGRCYSGTKRRVIRCGIITYDTIDVAFL